jgi:hypothetical protein
MGPSLGAEWTVEWAATLPNDDGCYDNLMLSKDQAQEYGDELVLSLRVDDEILQGKDLNPREPFAWRIEDGELVTKQISRQMFESVAEDDRHDSEYTRQVLQNRARRRLGDSR